MPYPSYMKQNEQHEFRPVDNPFEAIGDYSSAGCVLLPSATFNDLQYFAEREIKESIFDHASSIGHTVQSQLHLLAPKTEASHLTEIGVGPFKAYGMNGRFVPGKKTYTNSSKKANAVKGQWTPEQDSPRAGSAKILDSDGILGIHEQNHSKTQSSEEIVAPICDDFSVDMCDGLFGTKEDGDMNMECSFKHIYHAMTKVDFEFDMEMLWDNDDTVLRCLDEQGGSAEVETMIVKLEMDLIEMLAGTQKYGEAETN
ncbi:unnamed protein product [Urochloa decumbens]|uniref:Uncharacterized protein n=1 Tax=Urochloa decumbens TaxID=240449 RepID=A0ABC9FL18_9POAL